MDRGSGHRADPSRSVAEDGTVQLVQDGGVLEEEGVQGTRRMAEAGTKRQTDEGDCSSRDEVGLPDCTTPVTHLLAGIVRRRTRPVRTQTGESHVALVHRSRTNSAGSSEKGGPARRIPLCR